MSSLPKPVVVMFALQREAAPFTNWVRTQPRLLLQVTGVGRIRAEHAIEKVLRECPPTLVITAGFAGALRTGMAVGQVLYDADENFPMVPFLQRAGAKLGRFYAVEHMVITAQEKAQLHAQTSADAVEMESYWIRQHCRQAGVPSATVRVISDTAEEDLPLDFNRLTDDQQQLSPFKLARAVACSPAAWSGLRRLQKQTACAAEALAAVLQKALGGWLVQD